MQYYIDLLLHYFNSLRFFLYLALHYLALHCGTCFLILDDCIDMLDLTCTYKNTKYATSFVFVFFFYFVVYIKLVSEH